MLYRLTELFLRQGYADSIEKEEEKDEKRGNMTEKFEVDKLPMILLLIKKDPHLGRNSGILFVKSMDVFV